MNEKRPNIVFSAALILLIGVSSAADLSARASNQESGQSGAVEDDPAILVRQLGHKSFAVRARASRLLLEIGSPAIAALEKGGQSSIREVRIRSARVLGTVKKRDLERRLQAFVLDRKTDHRIPGWRRFAELVGDSGDSRALFVSMHKEEPYLMQLVDLDPSRLAEAMTKRVEAIRGNGRSSYNKLTLGTITAMFFLSAQPDVKLPRQIASNVGGFGNYHAFRTAFKSAGQRPILRKLLGRWIKAGIDPNYAFSFANQFELREGLELAVQVLSAKSPQKGYVRQQAILTIVKLGGVGQVPLLERLLSDKEQVTGSTTRNRIQYKTQIRDVALAAIISLTDADHRKIGFTRISFSTDRQFHTTSIGFASEEDRQKVFDNWANQKKPDASKPNASKPDASKPNASKPNASKPDASKPDASKPSPAKPNPAKQDPAKTDG